MKKFIKIFSTIVFFIIAIGTFLFVFNQNSDNDSFIQKIKTRLRFDIGSRRQYYREDYYSDLVRVENDVYNTHDKLVTEVSFAGRNMQLHEDYGTSQRFYMSLRPGYYNIRWRVYSDKYMGSRYRNYSRKVRIYRDNRQVYITIRGSCISVSQ
ncbi:MAG: hypothetical protein KR126chlam6_00537 [Candidatus Anoxychlamydiales bacterium]|nr:hypothetical protein [Candidatus Anoxychlamydiales bacterium]